jgi:hypothetical protein
MVDNGTIEGRTLEPVLPFPMVKWIDAGSRKRPNCGRIAQAHGTG